MSLKRKPIEPTYKILKYIIRKGEVKKEDINEPNQITDLDSYIAFLVKNGFISERQGIKQNFYTLTTYGENLYKILGIDNIFKTVLKIGKKEIK